MQWLHSIDPSGQLFLMLIAVALGAFVGLRREMEMQEQDIPGFVGFRTMPLITLLGALVTFFPLFPYMPIIGLATIIMFLGIAYYNGVFELKLLGLTSELSTLIMYLVGMLVGYGHIMQAVLITVFIATFAAFKPQLHRFAQTISPKEWAGVLQLLIISAIVLPILPQEAVDPWGVIIPYDIWVIVIIISAIGFVGYFFNKYFGAQKGIFFTSLVGSLISSTAVTTHIASKGHEADDDHSHVLFMGMLIAIATMLSRVLVVMLILTPAIYLSSLVFVPLAMIATTVAVGVYWYLREGRALADFSKDYSEGDPELKSPFELVPALQFGVLFIVVLFAVYFGKEYFGAYGVVATTFFSALVDVDAAVVSVLHNLEGGSMHLDLVALVLTVALIVNTMIKTFYIWAISRNLELTRLVLEVTVAASAIGAVTYLLV